MKPPLPVQPRDHREGGTGPESAPLLSVRRLSKQFPIHSRGFVKRVIGTVQAVDDVSFDLRPGETLGLVGESGSGKTTTARCILRAITPSAGEIRFRTPDGRVTDLATLPDAMLKPFRPHLQMVFQDPFSSLNPRMQVGQIVGEPLLLQRSASRREIDDRVAEMFRKVGLKPEHRTRYPHAFSGGQRQRIGIARALIMRPSLVVADEAVSALDVSVQAQILNLLKDLQADYSLTYLFVAHNLDVVRHFCDRVAVMYAGRIVELAPTNRLFTSPQHPYTKSLLAAVPWPDPDQPMQLSVSGESVDPSRLPPGCAFHPRCPACFDPCRAQRPELAARGSAAHQVACHLPEVPPA